MSRALAIARLFYFLMSAVVLWEKPCVVVAQMLDQDWIPQRAMEACWVVLGRSFSLILTYLTELLWE